MSNSRTRRTGKFRITVVFLSLLLIMTASFGALTVSANYMVTSVHEDVVGGLHYIDVPASYGTWSPSESASWLSVSKTGEHRFVINVYENDTASKRTATVYVNGSLKSGSITVSQDANSMSASASNKTFSASAKGSTATISVSIGRGSVKSSSCSSDWLRMTGSGSSYKVTVLSENLTGSDRTATAYFSSGNMSASVKFTQKAYELNLGSSTVSSDATGSEHSISVSSEYGSWSLSESSDWLSASKTGNYTFIIATQPNPNGSTRTAYVTVESGGTKKSVKVTQAANTLTVTTNSNSFAAVGGTNTITAKSLVGTTSASTSADWLTVTKNGGTYTVKASENLVGTPRKGVVSVKCGNITKEVTFTQNPHTLSVNTSTTTDTAKGGSHTISVTSSYSGWKVSSADSWITAGRNSATGFFINVEPNINSYARKGFVTVESAGVKQTVTVNQSGNTMTVSAASNTFAANGAAITVTAELLTGSASAQPQTDWISASKNGNTFSVKATENLTGAERTGSILIVCGNMSQKITFTQEPHTLSVGIDAVKTNAKGAAVPVSVSSSYNGWKVYSADAWITPTRTGNYTFNISAKPNVNGNIRTGTVTVESAGVFATVTVTQSANSMQVTSSKNSFLPGGGAAVITAKPETGATSASTGALWLTVVKTGNTYTVTADENLTGAPRRGVVSIHCGNITKTVTFTQNPYSTPASIGSITAAAEGSNHTISVPSAYGTWKVSEDCDWMSVAKTSNYTFLISVKPNIDPYRRTATVTLTTQDGIKTLEVEQLANTLDITVSSNSFDPDGVKDNTITAHLKTGTTSFSESCNWFTVTQKGNTFTVDAEENTTGSPRTGVVYIHCGNVAKTVTFTQNGHSIKTDLKEVALKGKASETTLGVITTDKNWRVSHFSSWLIARRTGNNSLHIYAPAHNSASTREGIVILTTSDGKASCTVSVKQYGHEITITLDANGGTLSPSKITRYYGQPIGVIGAQGTGTGQNTQLGGFYTKPDGGLLVIPSLIVTKDMTLYAYWVDPTPNTYAGGPGYEFETDPGSFDLNGHLANVGARTEGENGYAEVNGYAGYGYVEGESEFYFMDFEKWWKYYKNEDGSGYSYETGQELQFINAELNGGVGVSALYGDASAGVGDDMLGLEGSAEGSVGNARAEGSAEFSIGKDGVELNASGELMLSAAEGEVEGTINFLGFEITLSAGGYAGAVGVEGEIGVKDGKFVMEGGAAVGIGGSVGIEIGFNEEGWNNFLDFIVFWD
ncbi:MAG: BACON domain-containing protein [Clostridia bacterium]|nr:BACON domain-containing protein [Clostridia bacterium]